MHQLRLRAVGVAAGLALSAGALFFGQAQAVASSWSVVSSPNSRTSNNYLSGIACVSSSFCIAVGAYDYGALIESWNGTSWSIVPAPDSGISGLSSVACPSSSFCTAVGGIDNSGIGQTLIES